ncbi:MAG: hypothetical protein IKO03_12725 [Lachnospiraceae bacterium]|nr:hypothetical protein [Lachnospiraceae bacterium]MBR3509618.1 hypothetical protein [Lachnospiraceae bacterium]MBR6150702.1 hypothetical protein [Lachnospiraceae bacterium]
MKKYTVDRFCWITMSLMTLTMINIVLAIMRLTLEKDSAKVMGWVILSVLTGVISIVSFARGHWISRLQSKPFEESSEYIHVARGVNYAIKQELVRKQKYVKHLQEEQKKIWKPVALGAFLSTIGGLIFGFASPNVKMEMKALKEAWLGLTYPTLFLGTVMIFGGLRMMFLGFINSDSRLAYWLSEKFNFDTYSVKIVHENILIDVLSKRHEIEIEEEKKRRDAYEREEKERMDKMYNELVRK